MKKLLLILLLFTFSLQVAWSAASVYCQHETGKTAQHFGHHAHQHQSGQDNTKQKNIPAQSHTDCGYCHLSGAAIITPTLLVSVPPVITKLNFIYSLPLSSFSHERPERPQWLDRSA